MLFKKGPIFITCTGEMNGFEWSEAGCSIQLSGILVSSEGRSDVVIAIGCFSAREMTRPNLGEKRNRRRRRRRRSGSRKLLRDGLALLRDSTIL